YNVQDEIPISDQVHLPDPDHPRDHAGLANIDSASTILSHACHPASPTQSETRNAIIDGFHTLRFLPRA
ncbi:MAG: hypothetical protein ACK5ZJ_03530, partial [Acidobacteriota bacterium]